MNKKFIKIVALILALSFIFQQTGFAQVAAELNIASHLSVFRNSFVVDKFRPVHLRYLQYLPKENSFKLFLDKGDEFPQSVIASPEGAKPALPVGRQSLNEAKLQEDSQTLLKYFYIGLTLPNKSFWVNLRPDAEDNIIDEYLSKTDVGKIMLESDLQLKKDTAQMTSPATPEGREYWNKLYKKAEELYGYENVTIPTLTRPWIVPGEIIIRETAGKAIGAEQAQRVEGPSVYIYKATLKVMLEQDYLKDSSRGLNLGYNFKDSRSKALNEYSTQLIRELIIPKLTKAVNSSKRYAPLRQVYYSLILAQWFKARHKDATGDIFHQAYQGTLSRKVSPTQDNSLLKLIDSKDLTSLISKDSWSKTTYFQAYQKSFKDGEYNIQEPVYTHTGQTIRSYFSGGMELGLKTIPEIGNSAGSSSPISIIPVKGVSDIFKKGKIFLVPILASLILTTGLPSDTSLKLKVVTQAETAISATLFSEQNVATSLRNNIEGIMTRQKGERIDGLHPVAQYINEQFLGNGFSPSKEFVLTPKEPIVTAQRFKIKVLLSRLTSEGYRPAYYLRLLPEENVSDATPMSNIIATIPGSSHPEVHLIIGAHLDGDGANDNASGVAVVLELMRNLRSAQLPVTIHGVFFDGEEFLQAHTAGGKEFISEFEDRLKKEGGSIAGVINLDVVGGQTQRKLGQQISLRVVTSEKGSAFGMRTQAVISPFMTAIHIEDNEQVFLTSSDVFDAGYSDRSIAIMEASREQVESAGLYHTSGDVPETLDYDYMMKVIQAVTEVIRGIAFAPPGQLSSSISPVEKNIFSSSSAQQDAITASSPAGEKERVSLELEDIPIGSPAEQPSVSSPESHKPTSQALTERLQSIYNQRQAESSLLMGSDPSTESLWDNFETETRKKIAAILASFATTNHEAGFVLYDTGMTTGISSGTYTSTDLEYKRRLGKPVMAIHTHPVHPMISPEDIFHMVDSSIDILVITRDSNGWLFALRYDREKLMEATGITNNNITYVGYDGNKRFDVHNTDRRLKTVPLENMISQGIVTCYIVADNAFQPLNLNKIPDDFSDSVALVPLTELEATRMKDFMQRANIKMLLKELKDYKKELLLWEARLSGELIELKRVEARNRIKRIKAKITEGTVAIQEAEGLQGLKLFEQVFLIQGNTATFTADSPLELLSQAHKFDSTDNPKGVNPIVNLEAGGITAPTSSPSIPDSRVGGIDFRALPIVTQAMSNLKINLRDSPLRGQSLNINLDQELKEIQKMIDAGITPSTDRIKEYVQASCFKGNTDMQKVVSCIADILRLEEESCCATEATLRDILVVLESGRSTQELKEIFLG